MVLSAPQAYIAWINKHLGFNPRSQANSDALSDFVVADLRRLCPALKAALSTGQLIPRKNPAVRTKVAGRSIDLVLHEKSAEPSISVRVSVEHKSIMTAHGKARWNRYGDVIAYSNHMHNHRRDCIAGSLVIINTSAAYENPDAFAKGLKRPHFHMEKVVLDTVKIFAGIPLRSSLDDPNDQPEALAVIVIDYDGVNPAKLVSGAPAPPADSQIQYDRFIRRICQLYKERFKRRRRRRDCDRKVSKALALAETSLS